MSAADQGQEPGATLLIVTGNREDRRCLFDALDAENMAAIHTAKDIEQARGFLEQGIQFDLIIAEFAEKADTVVAFCASMQADASMANTPVLGILAADSRYGRWGYLNTPPGVREWIRSPVMASEALFRIRQLLSGSGDDHALEGDAYRFAFDASIDEIVVSDPHNGRIIEVSPSFEQVSGIDAGQIVGQPVGSIDVSHTREQRRIFKERLLADGKVRYRFHKQRADGSSYPVEMHARLMGRNGRMVQVGVIRDISPVLQAQQAFSTLSAMHAGVGSNNGMQHAAQLMVERMDLDLVAVVRLHQEDNYRAETLALSRGSSAEDNDLDISRLPIVKLVLEGEPIVHLGDAHRLANVDEFVRDHGYSTFVGLPLMDARRNVLGAFVLACKEDLSRRVGVLDAIRVAAARFAFEIELHESMEQGRAKGLQDALTGLPNRLLFNDRLQSALRASHRTGEMFAVMFVDLDRFKTINDSLGHDVGDQVLRAVSKRLCSSVRASDTVARYAGDEFTLILRHIVQREDVIRIADKIIRIMEAPLTLDDDSELKITASVGISFHPDDADTADELLKHADVAMYSAKGQGRNNFQAYEAVPEESHKQRIALEAKLRLAERNNELLVYYQPQVDSSTEDIIGMEALVRWEHPELGMISPGFFIPIAEETGLINSIGEWVMRTACKQAREWQSTYKLSLRVGVNLSALQLRQVNLVKQVSDILEESGLPPKLLELEVTESVNVRDIPNLLDTLGGLRALGCSIAIDDFGTGQSSLDYIRHFPADRVKIDQSFVRNIGVDPDDEAIVRATITMAHNLHHSVVAEGVEIEQHLDFLRAHGCEELQGYLFCRPLSAVSFGNLLAERERSFARARPVLSQG
ncbi:MAG: bifunctional diguanylate cyclase/phosphodiesterase [Rhodanobacteraceae bacterium]